jgi:hypothetical protein
MRDKPTAVNRPQSSAVEPDHLAAIRTVELRHPTE